MARSSRRYPNIPSRNPDTSSSKSRAHRCTGGISGSDPSNNNPYETATAEGCKLGINNLKDGIVTRGVLIDIPRLRNLPYLEAGTHVYREDIEAWEKQAGVKVAPGDALLLRTGRWAKRAQPGAGGYDASFLPFLKDRDVAIMGGMPPRTWASFQAAPTRGRFQRCAGMRFTSSRWSRAECISS